MNKKATKPKGPRRSSNPRFLIEHGGQLFLTRSVVRVDPRGSQLTSDQREGLRQLQTFVREQPREAVAVTYRPGVGGTAVEQLLTGHSETKSAMMGDSFAATEPVEE